MRVYADFISRLAAPSIFPTHPLDIPPTARWTYGDPSCFQVLTGGFTTDARSLLHLPQRPAQPSQS